MINIQSHVTEPVSEEFDNRPFLITHDLAGNSLFELDRIVTLAKGMPAHQIEYNAGNLPKSIDPNLTPANGLSVSETIRRIEECQSWMVIKSAESDPEYRNVLETSIREVSEALGETAPEFSNLRSFVFVSSPCAVTPFHIDPESQFLLQIAGDKRIQIFDREDREIIPAEQLRDHWHGGHRNQPFPAALADRGDWFDMPPGVGVPLPVLSPHWVQVMNSVSISFSVTVETVASQAYRRRFAQL